MQEPAHVPQALSSSRTTSGVAVSKLDTLPLRGGSQRRRGASRQPVDSQARRTAALVGEQAPRRWSRGSRIGRRGTATNRPGNAAAASGPSRRSRCRPRTRNRSRSTSVVDRASTGDQRRHAVGADCSLEDDRNRTAGVTPRRCSAWLLRRQRNRQLRDVGRSKAVVSAALRGSWQLMGEGRSPAGRGADARTSRTTIGHG